MDMSDALAKAKSAFHGDDAAVVRALLEQFPHLNAAIDAPIGPFDSPAIIHVRSREMLDVLLDAGADINARSRWWAGGFGLLDHAEPELATYAISRGAVVTAHAAARLGMLDTLKQLIASDPQLVHARGGDGQTPLHVAKNVEVAAFLLDCGAAIDARDVDHESTPAQHMIRDRQDVARFLVGRGCAIDILMAAALGELDLIDRCLAADPACIRMRVSDEYFPMSDKRSGGTIYQWTLGWYVSAHQVAREFGHAAAFDRLMERSPDDVKLLAACWLGDDEVIAALRPDCATLVSRLQPAERRHLAHAARNNDLPAVRRMLDIGLPIDATGQHAGTPLHWAAFHGNAEMAKLLLTRNPPLEVKDADFSATPLGWAIHGSENGWHRETGDYPATVEALLRAGAVVPAVGGTSAVRAVLAAHRPASGA